MRKRLVSLAAAILFSAFAINAQQTVSPDHFEFKPDQSVYVVAVQTSSVTALTSIATNVFDMPSLNPAPLYSRVGPPSRNGKDQRQIRPGRFMLGDSVWEFPTLERSVSASAPDTVISTDPLLKTEIEEAFKKQQKFKLAASAESADFIFFAFSIYPTASAMWMGGNTGPPTIANAHRGYSDSNYSTTGITALSFVLPASVYRQTRKDMLSLSHAARWQAYGRHFMGNSLFGGKTAQQSVASIMVKRFQDEILKKQKPQPSSSQPQLAQVESEKKRPALKTPNEAPTPAPPASSDADTIKIETALAVVPVTVLDREGKYVRNLTQHNFQIFEDNQEQKIDRFSAVDSPFNVVLLLDTSRSMRLKDQDLHRAAMAFVEQLRPQDRVMVVSFNSEVYLNAELTSDHDQLRAAIAATRTQGATRLYDAVDLVITERLKEVEGRKAIVLFTDGVDNQSRLAVARSTLELMEEAGVLVYTIHYNTANDVTEPKVIQDFGIQRIPNVASTGEEAYRQASQYLRELTQRTGARFYQAETISNLNQAFSQIAGELRQQYAISYYPTNAARDGSYRRIRIQVDRPEVVVRARPGYRAAQDAPARDQNNARPAIKHDQP